MIKLKQLLTEKTVRLSTMKDANFEPGRFVQLMGKKGMVKLDKKSVHSLAKIIRQMMGKKGMGWSFTMGEGKLNEREVNWGTINNVFIKFLKANTKTLEKYVKSKDLEKTKGGIKSIISGLSNAQRNLKLEGKLSEKFNLNKRYIDDVRTQLKSVKKLSPKEIKAYQDTLIKKLDKKQLQILSKAKINHLSKLASQALGEGKLNEGSKVVTLPNGVKVKIDFKGLTFVGHKGKPVFLDRKEMEIFFKATARYLK